MNDDFSISMHCYTEIIPRFVRMKRSKKNCTLTRLRTNLDSVHVVKLTMNLKMLIELD